MNNLGVVLFWSCVQISLVTTTATVAYLLLGKNVARMRGRVLQITFVLTLVLSALVVAWIHLKVNTVGQQAIHWPGLDKEIFITAYGKPYEAVWNFQPLATGTAILFTTFLVAILARASRAQVASAFGKGLVQVRLPALTATCRTRLRAGADSHL